MVFQGLVVLCKKSLGKFSQALEICLVGLIYSHGSSLSYLVFSFSTDLHLFFIFCLFVYINLTVRLELKGKGCFTKILTFLNFQLLLDVPKIYFHGGFCSRWLCKLVFKHNKMIFAKKSSIKIDCWYRYIPKSYQI